MAQVTNEVAKQRVDAVRRSNIFNKNSPLTKFERKQLATETDAVYIYNVSPIWSWRKDFPRFGPVTVPKCNPGQRVTEPLVLDKRIIRPFDKGNRLQGHMIEEPIEIAEDLLCCSQDYPGRPENNKLLFGCFYLVNTSLADLSDKKRDDEIGRAVDRHIEKCLIKVDEADTLAIQHRDWITKMYVECAVYLEAKGLLNLSEHPWVTKRGKRGQQEDMKECSFCAFPIKATAVVCTNCKEIIDQAGYDKLKAKQKKVE